MSMSASDVEYSKYSVRVQQNPKYREIFGPDSKFTLETQIKILNELRDYVNQQQTVKGIDENEQTGDIIGHIPVEYIEQCPGFCFYNSMYAHGIINEQYKKCDSLDSICEALKQYNYCILKPKLTLIDDTYNFRDAKNAIGPMFDSNNNIYTQFRPKFKRYAYQKINDDGPMLYFGMDMKKNKQWHIFAIKRFSNYCFRKDQVYRQDFKTGKLINLRSEIRKERDPNNLIYDNLSRFIFFDVETASDYNRDCKFRTISYVVGYFDMGYKKKENESDDEYKKSKNGRLKQTKTFENFTDSEIDIANYTEKNIVDLMNRNKIKFVCSSTAEETLWTDISDCFSKDKVNYLLTFNGSNFDNIFLNQSCHINGYRPFFMCNSGKLELKGTYQNCVFRSYDLARFIPGNLKSICYNFVKTEQYRKISSENLFKQADELLNKNPQELSNENSVFYQKMKAYNINDVISLGVILCNFFSTMDKIEGRSVWKMITSVYTLPGFAKKLYEESRKIHKLDVKELFIIPDNEKSYNLKNAWSDKVKFEADDMDERTKIKFQPKYDKACEMIEKTINSGLVMLFESLNINKTGGRCEAHQKGISKEKQYSLDFSSLYPMAMYCSKYSYPCGTPHMTSKYEKDAPFSIYLAYVKQSSGTIFYCEKTKQGNNWENRNWILTVITSYEIKEIIEPNKWEFKIVAGFYYKKVIAPSVMFSCLKPYLLAKTAQDEYKAQKNPLYNECVRTAAKNIMNSLSGKFMQQFEDSEVYMDLDGKMGSFSKNEKMEQKYRRFQNLIHEKGLVIGLNIYSISKLIMYSATNGYNNSNFMYGDTDSCKLSQTQYEEYMKFASNLKLADYYNPVAKKELGVTDIEPLIHDGKSLKKIGHFSDENAEDKNVTYNLGVYCDKKEYSIYSVKYDESGNPIIDDKTKHKVMFKGISKNQLVFISDIANIIYSRTTHKFYRIKNYKPNSDEIPILKAGYTLQCMCDETAPDLKYNPFDHVSLLEIKQKKNGSYKFNVASEVYQIPTIYEKLKDIIEQEGKKDTAIKAYKIMTNKLNGIKNYLLCTRFQKNKQNNTIRVEILIKCI